MANKVAHLFAYGEIIYDNLGSSIANDWGVITMNTIVDQVNANSDADEFVLHINSRGGSVYTAYAIHDFLRALKKPIATIAEGLVASSGTILLCAGDTDKREATSNTRFLIHNPSGEAYGTADDMQRAADDLRAEEEKLAEFYAMKTGSDKDTLLQIMAKDEDMPLSQAVELGFLSGIVDTLKAVASFKKPKNEQSNTHTMSTKIKFIAELSKTLESFGFKPLKASTEDTQAATTMNVKTTDGAELKIEMQGTEPAVGDTVTLADGTAVSDDSYNLETGITITVVAGNITEVVTTDATAKTDTEKIAALEKQVNDLKAECDALKAAKNDEQLNALKQENEALVAAMKETNDHLKAIKTSYVPRATVATFKKTEGDDNKDQSPEEVKSRFGKLLKKNDGKGGN